jgi:hypothetical protein
MITKVPSGATTGFVTGGCLVVVVVSFVLWYIVASDYGDGVASGSYQFAENGESSTLVLKPDHSFQQEELVIQAWKGPGFPLPARNSSYRVRVTSKGAGGPHHSWLWIRQWIKSRFSVGC